ncbi:tetratricopeptide repeat-containing sensor histidine kinase [Hymenobacter rigui]|uniref:histidine kinase n=1 Tax=Hymenobacter rigui TaxID=334424 RepID=A0A428KTN9_9BACT|nr:tetratricopeptide repeat protein [Hymenobacter rigui]RSK49890.1 tetratricopeptide repeat protein [Hymenobacter rigui]
MMLRLLRGLVALLLLLPLPLAAQSPQTRPLQRALALAPNDTTRVLLLADLAASYRYSRFDSVQWYARQGLELARRITYPKGEGRCLSRLAILLGERGNLPQALRVDLQALRLNQQSHDTEGTARTLNQTGLLYFALDDYRPALQYFFRALHLYQQARTRDTSQLISVITNLGASYEGLRRYDSAAFFLNQAWRYTASSRAVHQSSWGNPAPYVLRELGLLQHAQGHPEAALLYYRRSAKAAFPENDLRSASRAYQYMAELYQTLHQPDSSVHYARKALALANALPFVVGVVRNSTLLTQAFEARQQPDSTLKYMRAMLTAQDSLYNPRRIKQLDAIGFTEQQRLQELEDERTQLVARLQLAGLLTGLAGLLLISILLWRNNRQQRRAHQQLRTLHEQVSQQAQELTAQRDDLARTLQELKIAQSQLVLREKMASLGELMAGVAHEIQNPVNCVRKFAAISVELCEDVRQELSRLTLPEHEQELVDEMLQNLGQNQAKIMVHGQRAESIVRGMLEYSQGGHGPRQPTDLNLLAEEYLRLTYHDLRAKNRHFNVALLLRLDPALTRVEVVRQDIGRALVGVFSAALLAVQQRLTEADEDYVPQVELHTLNTGTTLEIRVRDNGRSLPAEALTTLFQRFPGGSDTSLSLALSYDIITRAQGGTLVAASLPSNGTEYTISLPTDPLSGPARS